MKATLSMKTGVLGSATPLPSDIDMAKQLHQFEIDQRNKTIADLKQQIELATGEHQQEIIALQNKHQEKLILQREKFSLAIEAVELNSGRDDEKLQQLQDYSEQLATAGDALGAEKDRLQDQIGEQAETITNLTGHLSDHKNLLAAAISDLKQLRSLNPERLTKKVKEQQKTISQKNKDNAALRDQNSRLQADNKAKANNIAQLDKALDKASKDINEQNTLVPLDQINLGALGHWEIYGNARMNHYDILDKANNVSLCVEVANGAVNIPEVRNIPKAIITRVIQNAAHNQKTEAAIAQSQKPLTEQSKEA